MAALGSARLTYASIYRFSFTIKKDGVAWNLTGGTVKALFRKPNNAMSVLTCTISDAANGLAYYDNVASDLDQTGMWKLALEVTVGATTQKSTQTEFEVGL